MSAKRKNDPLGVMSEAVQRWFRFYEVEPDEALLRALCSNAIELFNDGHRSTDEIASILIDNFVGASSARVNAPSSATLQ